MEKILVCRGEYFDQLEAGISKTWRLVVGSLVSCIGVVRGKAVLRNQGVLD